MAKTKVLVTGVAGFIGMHTALKLIDNAYQVVGLDNLNAYYDVNLKHRRLQQLGVDVENIKYGQQVKGKKDLSFIKLDLTDEPGIKDLFEVEEFDIVINLAAQPGVRYSLEHPDIYVSSNITGFMNILEGCRQHQVKHLVYASTSSVYGLNTETPFREDMATEHPISLYAATKKANEMMAHSYSHLYRLPSTGLRFFTVYGPWGRPDMALYKFTKNIIEGKPIDVYNNGDMKRDFTFISDVVEGICRVIPKIPGGIANMGGKYPANQSSAPYALFNIGCGRPLKLMDYIRELEAALAKEAKTNFMPMQAGDVHNTHASIENLSKEIGYHPVVEIKEGIEAFVSWYLTYHGIKLDKVGTCH